MGREPIKRIKIEHLFHGHFIQAGRPAGQPRLVAYSTGITAGQWKECLKLAPLTPAGEDDDTRADSVALGIFRGHTADYILTHARRSWAADGVSTILLVHYLLMPKAVLGALAGNLEALQGLLRQPMPGFETLESDLPPYPFPTPEPPTVKQQMNALTSLLNQCQSDARTVRGLLGSLVLGLPIAITGCEAPIQNRLSFLQGLLSLLPPPARVHVTFATHVTTPAKNPAQIQFLARGKAPPEKCQVFDWDSGSMTTTPPQREPYSGFAVGRMQLAPVELARRLDTLSETTRHYMDDLPFPEALAKVARRAVMDTALDEGQPLYREDIVEILDEDPSLGGQRRINYALYLLRVTLALDEPEPADVLVPLIQQDSALEKTLFKELERTAREGSKAEAAYRLLNRWLGQTGAVSEAWPRILGLVTLAYMRRLVEQQKTNAVADMLEDLEAAPITMEMDQVMDRILRNALPLARKNSRIARATLRLAAHHLEPRDFDALMADSAFANQLPAPVQTALICLDPQKAIEGSGRGVLLRAGKALGEQGQVVLARFAEHAVAIHRQELVDVPALEVLRDLAESGYASRFSEILQQTVWALARSEELTTLPEPGPLLLAQILYLLDQSADLIKLLQHYQGKLYGARRRDEFRQLVRALFQVTAAQPEQSVAALAALEAAKDFDHHALALAYRSTLHVHDWDKAVDHAVTGLLAQMDQHAELAVTLGFPFTVELMRHVAKHRDPQSLLRVATPLFTYLPEDAGQAAPILKRIWPLLAEEEEMRQVAIELLRIYARRIPDAQARKLLRLYRGKRARRERDALQATLALRPIFRTHDLITFVETLKETVELFTDLLISFEYNPPPGPKLLTKELLSLTGAVNDAELTNLSKYAAQIADDIEQLGRDVANDNTRESLVANQAVPRSGLGLMYWMGGYFAEGQQVDYTPPEEALPHTFGSRTLNTLYREIEAAAALLRGVLWAFPPDDPPSLDLTALRGEFDSQWDLIRLYDQRRIQEPLAVYCQAFAQVVYQMAQTGGTTTFLGGDASKQVIEGKSSPQSAIDALRWVSGYYAGKHPPR